MKGEYGMTRYRNQTQILSDVLVATKECGQEGIKTTVLLSRSNLSHGRLQTFLSTLTSSGLINRIQYDGKNTFVITEKGRMYLEQYQKFAGIAEAFGMEM